jgi:putative transcriptional regulator
MRSGVARWLATAVVAAVAACASLAAAPAGEPLSQLRRFPLADPRDLASGKLLVASRAVVDPNFAETVVLLFVYSAAEGAGGLIVNRPSSVPVRRVLPDLPAPGGPDSLLFFGGPVSTSDVRGIWRSPRPVTQAIRVLPDLVVLPTKPALDAVIADGAPIGRLRLYGGYAGWRPGQLEAEVQRGDWYIAPGDSAIIFASEPEAIWRQQIRRLDVVAA